MKTDETKIDLKKARVSPAAVFETPEALLAHPGLSRADKIELLRRWELDAVEIQVAEEENMRPGEPSDLLDRVLKALHALDAGPDLNRPGPTKHGSV